jgi:hypothetical protein
MQHYKSTRIHLKGHLLENYMCKGEARAGAMAEVASYLKLRECYPLSGYRISRFR